MDARRERLIDFWVSRPRQYDDVRGKIDEAEMARIKDFVVQELTEDPRYFVGQGVEVLTRYPAIFLVAASQYRHMMPKGDDVDLTLALRWLICAGPYQQFDQYTREVLTRCPWTSDFWTNWQRVWMHERSPEKIEQAWGMVESEMANRKAWPSAALWRWRVMLLKNLASFKPSSKDDSSKLNELFSSMLATCEREAMELRETGGNLTVDYFVNDGLEVMARSSWLSDQNLGVMARRVGHDDLAFEFFHRNVERLLHTDQGVNWRLLSVLAKHRPELIAQHGEQLAKKLAQVVRSHNYYRTVEDPERYVEFLNHMAPYLSNPLALAMCNHAQTSNIWWRPNALSASMIVMMDGRMNDEDLLMLRDGLGGGTNPLVYFDFAQNMPKSFERIGALIDRRDLLNQLGPVEAPSGGRSAKM